MSKYNIEKLGYECVKEPLCTYYVKGNVRAYLTHRITTQGTIKYFNLYTNYSIDKYSSSIRFDSIKDLYNELKIRNRKETINKILK